MPTKAEKEELARVREQFRRDLTRLREEYENLELAHKTGIDPGNLSAYGSGTKKPGIKVLNQFYSALADETENPFYKTTIMEDMNTNKDGEKDPNGQKRSKGQKEPEDYDHDAPPSDHIDRPSVGQDRKDDVLSLYKELYAREKLHNADRQSTINKMFATGDRLFEFPTRSLNSLDKMVETHDKNNQSTLIMAKTHQAIINAFLQQFGDRITPPRPE